MSTTWDLQSVTESIETLYSSNDTARIRQIQEYLQPLQRSDEGYNLGIQLLNHPLKSCKYFGALTITVFINTHTQLLSDMPNDQLVSIANDLLQITMELSQDLQANMFIIKKNLSNIVLLSIKFYKKFDITALIPQLLGNTSLQDVNEVQLVILITFYTILAEDTSKSDHHPDIHKSIHGTFPLLNNIFSVVNGDTTPSAIVLLLLNCINSWVIYISVAEHNSDQVYSDEEVTPLIEFLLQQFNVVDIIPNLDKLSKSFQVLTEIIETSPKLLSTFKPLIASMFFDPNNIGNRFITQICNDAEASEENSEEVESFVNLLIAYLNLNIIYISRNILDDSVQRIVGTALELSNYRGNPVQDEKVSEQFLIFWEEFVNIYIDDEQLLKEAMKAHYPQFEIKRNELLTKLSSIYWSKCKFYDGAPQQEFTHYRAQISDLFIVLYQLLGTSLYSTFTQGIVNELANFAQSGNQSHLKDIEASLYILFKITDDLTFYDDESTKVLLPLIDMLFQNQMIQTIESNAKDLPQIHVTLLNLLSSIYFFFKSEQGSKYCPETFNFLFTIILGNSAISQGSSINLSLIASKTVLKICQDSQKYLVEFLPNLRLILNEMIENVQFDNLIRERMTNAYISISQSLKDPVVLGDIISNLLQEIIKVSKPFIEDTSTIIAKLPPGLSTREIQEKLEEYAISLTSCINEIGKATQLPDDVEEYLTPEQFTSIDTYWKQDPLGIKSMVLNCVNQFSLNIPFLCESTLVTEKCCCILKNGLAEPIEGPFKFDLGVILDYLIAKINRSNIQSVTPIYKLVETVVITNSKQLTPAHMDLVFTKLFSEKRAIFAQDIDLIKSAMDLFRTILEQSPSLVISLPQFQNDILTFALEAFQHHEMFITKSVTKFWASIIILKRGNANDHEIFRILMTQSQYCLGKRLTEYLTVSFVKNHRSNLDQFYPVFRNLIAKYPMEFKLWLKQSLITHCLKEGKFSEGDADQLVAKLMLTRGQRQANEILKNFWLQVNGLTNY